MSDQPRGQPHKPDHTPPEQGAKLDHNPDGRTPNGIPDGASDQDPAGWPDSDRHKTETTPNKG